MDFSAVQGDHVPQSGYAPRDAAVGHTLNTVTIGHAGHVVALCRTENAMHDRDAIESNPGPNAEIRHATALKCDVVDSTRIWGRMDPSDGLALTRAFKKIVTEIIDRHAGHIDRWEGDGALVLFGYPQAQEDAPEAAIRAGLELVDLIRTVRVADARLEFRVGIASGAISIDLLSKTIDGMALNKAERIKTAALPGQVVIDDATRQLAKRFFEYEDMGIHAAKGFDAGLRIWKVQSETALASRFEAHRVDASCATIIGRTDELALLANSWSRSHKGRGQIVLLVGDAGMGKSRLAKAVLDSARGDGATCLQIDCAPRARNSPLYPIGVLLRRVSGIQATTDEATRLILARKLLGRSLEGDALQDALAYLAPLFGLASVSAPESASPDQVREHTIDVLVGLLRAIAARGPLVVLFEDLHWADDTTANVLQRFAGGVATLAVTVVATTRARADATLALPQATSNFREITLDPLPSDSATALVRAVDRDHALSDAVERGIVSCCEGVPLILEEVTRNALEASARGEKPSFESVSQGPVPAPLQLVVESRIERWPQHKSLVQAASVLGREFSIRLLQQMVHLPHETVAGVLAELALHGLFAQVNPVAADRARFPHAMIRDAVYQTLLRDDRRALHSRVADTLGAQHPPRPDASPDELAHHLCEASRFEEAIQVRLDASGQTAARGAYVETEGHCEAAIKLLDQIAHPQLRREYHFKLLLQLGVATTGRHGYASPAAETTYRRAREVCGETNEAARLYPIMRGLAALNLVRGNLSSGYELSLQAMQLAEQSHQPEFRIDALSLHCYATLYYRSLAECQSWIEKCLALYRQEQGETLNYPVPNDAAIAALAILPTVHWLRGDAQAAEAAITQGLEHAARSKREFDKAFIYGWIAGVRLTQRRFAQCREAAQIAMEIGQRNGFREWYVTGFLLHRLALAAEQPSPDALKEALETCTALAAEGIGLNASWYLWAMAMGYRTVGVDAAAAQFIEQAFLRAQASDETRMHAELLIAKAQLQSDPLVALRLLTEALDLADRQGGVANALRAAAELVVRAESSAPDRKLARATLGLLDGRGAFPDRAGWMQQRLTDLRTAIDALPRSTAI